MTMRFSRALSMILVTQSLLLAEDHGNAPKSESAAAKISAEQVREANDLIHRQFGDGFMLVADAEPPILVGDFDGDGIEDGVVIGPMINGAAIEKIKRHVADALDKGAKIVAESKTVPEGRQYARPLVLGGATTEMLLASEETFGPVAPLFRFETEEEAITIANGTPFGLAAYFYTESLKRSWRVAEALEFGMVAA